MLTARVEIARVRARKSRARLSPAEARVIERAFLACAGPGWVRCETCPDRETCQALGDKLISRSMA